MKLLNLLVLAGPALLTAESVLAAPARGPLITVPGNFSEIMGQNAHHHHVHQGDRDNSTHISNSTVSTTNGTANNSATAQLPSSGNSTTDTSDSAAAISTSTAMPSASTGANSTASTVSPSSSNDNSTTPAGGRDRSTAGKYGPLPGRTDQSKNSTSANSNSTSTAGEASTPGDSAGKYNGTTISHGDNETTIISWLATASDSKGGGATCRVSIKSNGSNGTEIDTEGVSSPNVHQVSADSGSTDPSPRIRCNTPSVINRSREAKVRSLVTQKKSQLKKQRSAASSQQSDLKHALASQNITIPVVFHIITDGDKGALSDSTIGHQIDVLNNDYKDYGFAFNLQNTSRVDNGTWFSGASYGGDAVYDMKTTLRQGGPSTLNVYTVDFSDGTLGFATFPWDYEESPKEDGIVVQYSTLPGGSETNYNLGKTTTHETGHFLGLYHTFGISSNGCQSPGDFVDDTPPQMSPTSGCPAKRDSCSGDNLDDPIHNYMDYSTDPCLTEFTEGQAVRMQAMTSYYRLGQNSTDTQ